MVGSLVSVRFRVFTAPRVPHARCRVAVVAAVPTRASCRDVSRNLASRIRARNHRRTYASSAVVLRAVRKNPNEIAEMDIDAMVGPGEEPTTSLVRPVTPTPEPTPPPEAEEKKLKRNKAVLPESTDAIATFMTRRFGIAGGLVWLGVLTFGVVSEQLKTRKEVREALENTVEVEAGDIITTVSATGVISSDLKIGGGETVKPGYLIAADIVATVVTSDPEGRVRENLTLVDTRTAGRQLVFSFGKPLGPLSTGLLESVATMRQGGRRIVTVPPAVGFGPNETQLQGNITVPPNATVRYDIELTRVSVPPS